MTELATSCGDKGVRPGRRFVGWRVRWEWRSHIGTWESDATQLRALPESVEHVRFLRGLDSTREVRLMRVYVRAKEAAR